VQPLQQPGRRGTRLSKHRVGLLPLGSRAATNLIQRSGQVAKSWFLAEVLDGGKVRLMKGPAAIYQLARLLGPLKGLRLLTWPGPYAGQRLTRPCCGQGGKEVTSGRMKAKSSKELKGEAKRAAVNIARNSEDVKNVLRRVNGRMPAEDDEFLAFHHIVDVDGREYELLVVGFAAKGKQDYFVALYQFSELVERFLTGAFTYVAQSRDGRRVLRLVAISVNGADATDSLRASEGSHCGGCVDPWWGLWDYEYPVCIEFDWYCYGICVGSCTLLPYPLSAVCYITAIFLCAQVCCIQWGHICASCGYF